MYETQFYSFLLPNVCPYFEHWFKKFSAPPVERGLTNYSYHSVHKEKDKGCSFSIKKERRTSIRILQDVDLVVRQYKVVEVYTVS